jgi:hypothetical protein
MMMGEKARSSAVQMTQLARSGGSLLRSDTSAIGKMPAQPVDATLYPRWKDEVYSVISEDSRLSVSSQAHPNKVVSQLNERPRKAFGIETPAERFNASVASTG